MAVLELEGRLGGVELSKDVLSDVLEGLNDVERESGLCEAYTQPADVYEEIPANYAEQREEQGSNYVEKPTYKKDTPPTSEEIDHAKTVEDLTRSRKEMIVKREKDLMNLPYVCVDERAKRSELNLLARSPSLKKLLYNLGSSFYIGDDLF